MGMNNVNVEGVMKFAEEVRADPSAARKVKRVEGEWVFTEGKPQFKSTLEFKEGAQITESDFAPFMGGRGLAPDPVQYCLYGTAACFAATFAAVAAERGVALRSMRIAVENRMDLSRPLGLSENPNSGRR